MNVLVVIQAETSKYDYECRRKRTGDAGQGYPRDERRNGGLEMSRCIVRVSQRILGLQISHR